MLGAETVPADAADFAVTWNTDDPNVATVTQEGKDTAVAPGVVTITASCNSYLLTGMVSKKAATSKVAASYSMDPASYSPFWGIISLSSKTWNG